MRRPIFQMTETEAKAVLQAAPVIQLATTGDGGRPILRTVHGVLAGDAVAFHGSPVGEKQEGIGRPAVIGAEEIVASIPSYFVDPERACPATTYYRSVQVHGCIEVVTDMLAKARVMQALMERYQPDGGHVPITADHPLYARAVAGIQVLQVPIARIDGKSKLGQNLRPEQVGSIVTQLWRRGRASDAKAVDLVRQANPRLVVPDFLQGPAGTVLRCHVTPAEVQAMTGPVHGDWHTALQVPGAVWVGVEGPNGRMRACLAGASDGRQVRLLAGRVTADAAGAEGLWERLSSLLLDHPALRHAAGRPALAWEGMAGTEVA